MLTGFKSNEHSTTKAALVKKMGEQQDKQTKKKGAKINPNRTDKAGRTKIFYATTSGHVERVQQLVESGANVNFVDNAGWTPLHEAALKGEYAIAKYLIECGAKLDVQGFGQDTPLHDAAVNGSAAIVQLLVDAGANVFALNERKERPIDLCENAPDARHILQQKMDALDKLIARDENGQTSLHRACVEANLEKAAKLIQQGANVNAHDNKRHATPLYLVCHDPKYKPVLLDMVKLLVNKSAVVDISDNQGNTPLHEASRLGHTELVEYLVTQANADVYIENNKQQTAYDAAASHPPVRQILTARMDEVRLEKVASNALDEIAVRTAKKKEPERQLTREERKIQNYMKQFASMNNNHHQDEHIQEDPKPKRQDSPQLTPQRQKSPSAVVKKKKGGRPPKARTPQKSATPESVKSNTSMARLDPFKKDGCGRTQLHKYALKGSETNVAQLLQLGADPNAADHAGWTPLHEAALEGHVDTVKLLLDHNAEINIKGGANMDTPLHDAVENNHCDVVELLLERGADPFARNAKGAEPMDVAVEKKHDDIVLVLEATNPVSRKKSALQKKKRKDVHMASHTDADTQPKKRRLVQAAHLEKTKSPNHVEMEQPTVKSNLNKANAIEKTRNKAKRKIKVDDDDEQEDEEEDEEEEEVPLNKKNKVKKEQVVVKIESEQQQEQRSLSSRKHVNDTTTSCSSSTVAEAAACNITPADPHSPIPTPPPESSMLMTSKQKQDALQYLPLYTVQLNGIFYVVDYQVSLLLGMSDSHELWSTYPDLPKRLVTFEEKSRLWSHFKTMLKQERQTFLDKQLYFTQLDDIVTLIKTNFNYLCNRLITITLDMGYHEKSQTPPPASLALAKFRHSLPAKMRMKLSGYTKPSS